MAMSDPIADMLTRMRNALLRGFRTVDIPHSRLKEQMCAVLKREGYIDEYSVVQNGPQGSIRVVLRYVNENQPVIQGLKRVSKPSLRVRRGSKDLRQVRSGLGISIISTSHGVMTGKQARSKHVGGEVLCEVW
jgi:small subunit ribosomal protein S8